MDKPFVSVVIPAYNYADYLPYTLRNVLEQQDVLTEIIVVDDGSTDNTSEVAKEFKDSIRYIYQDNRGLSGARNTGIAAAQGEFLVFLDADDLFYPGTLRSQCDTLLANPKAKLSICHNQRFLGSAPEGPFEDDGIYPLFKDNFPILYCRGNLAPVHAVMLRTADARKIGEFDTNLGCLEDYDYWLRGIFSGYGVAINLNGLALYRKHDKNMSLQSSKMVMHECILRSKVHEKLLDTPRFMPNNRPDAWFAHASRCFDLAASLEEPLAKLVDKTLTLSEEAFKFAIQEIKYNSKSWRRSETTDDCLSGFVIQAARGLKWLIKDGRTSLEWMLDYLYKNYPETCLPREARMDLYYNLAIKNIHMPMMVKDFESWKLNC